jgi:hypothetical protein
MNCLGPLLFLPKPHLFSLSLFSSAYFFRSFAPPPTTLPSKSTHSSSPEFPARLIRLSHYFSKSLCPLLTTLLRAYFLSQFFAVFLILVPSGLRSRFSLCLYICDFFDDKIILCPEDGSSSSFRNVGNVTLYYRVAGDNSVKYSLIISKIIFTVAFQVLQL